jgi:predicted MPP superfamily phosphohydrolase
MGILSFLLVLSLTREIASLLIQDSLHTPGVTGALLFGSFSLFLMGVLNARYRVDILKTEVYFDNLPEEFSGLKMIQISDLHVGPTIKKPFVEKVIEKVNEVNPDLIVLTGDLIDGTVRNLSAEIEGLSQLKSRYGKFYVTGNHEYYWGAEPWIQFFKKQGITPLLNKHVTISIGNKKLLLCGITDPAALAFSMEGPDLSRSLEGAPKNAYPKILLCHQPKFAESAEKLGFDLQLSGHTHGGQFFPWTLVASLVHTFPYGLRRLKKLQVYVSRGTGYWGPPVRLGSPAEISLLVLKKNEKVSALLDDKSFSFE